jgi:hypothetical protein
LLVALAVVLSAVSVSARDSEDENPSQLSGLWEFTVVNLTPAGFLPDPLLILGNFTRDGSFLNSSTHPGSGVPIQATPTTPCCLFTLDVGQAHWIRTGPRAFVLETWRLVFSTIEYQKLTGIPAETFVGFVQAQSDVSLNQEGDKMEGRARFQLLDKNKQPLAFPVVGDITGFRVPLVPIPIP